MNESYIDIVRKSLYPSRKSKPSRPSKKLNFREGAYKSENVFENIPDNVDNLVESNNIKITRKSANDKKNKKKMGSKKIQEKKKIKRKPKSKRKKKETIQLELLSEANNSPSKSETDSSTLIFSRRKVRKDFFASDSERDSEDEFDVDNFFNFRDHSFNESITEAHSGIDYEFATNSNSEPSKPYRVTIKPVDIEKDTAEVNELLEKCEISTVQKTSDVKKSKRKKVNTNGIVQKVPKFKESVTIDEKDITSNKSETIEPFEMKISTSKKKSSVIEDKILKNVPRDKVNEPEEIVKLPDTNACEMEVQLETNLELETSESIVRQSNGEIRSNSTNHNISNDDEFCQQNSSSPSKLSKSPLDNLPHVLDITDSDSSDKLKLVILKENMCVPYFGMFALQVLHGQIDILGTILDKSSTISKPFSPRGSALLSIQNVTNDSDTNLKELLPNINVNNIPIDSKTAVLKCTKLIDKSILFMEKYISQQIFPKELNSSPRLTFPLKDDWNVITVDESWNDIINIVNSSTRLLITGGKGVGKSTFLRYAINKLLTKYEEIRIIDLDPGQSEFFVPGCISVLNIKEPIFGPNYTHLRKPDRSFLSDINIGHNPQTYIKSIASLMKYVSSLPDLPTLINFMGFTRGLGIKILSSAISYIRPTDVVQINSANPKKNYNKNVHVHLVHDHCDFFGGDPNGLNYNLHVVYSMTDQNVGGWSLEPRQVREMCVLVYLGQMMRTNITTLTDQEVPMYKISLSSLKLTNIEKEEIPPAAVNANLVALCDLDESSNFLCFGYGVVRGIDLDNNLLVLITPESIDTLEKVYYLVLGSVSLPPSMYMMPENVSGLVPYVMEGDLEFLGQIVKRTYLPATKR